MFKLSIKFIKQITDPFKDQVWPCYGLLSNDLIKNSEAPEQPYSEIDDGYDDIWIINHHASRVKWFVENGWDDPILIDVGVPCLGYNEKTIIDGNHRLAAAIYKKYKSILCLVDGELDLVKPYVVP